jgi:preprotein translocase subunit SecA
MARNNQKSIGKLATGKDFKKIASLIMQIDALEEEYEKLSAEALKHKTVEFKERLKNNGDNLSDILPEAFAAVERRAIRHWDCANMMFNSSAASTCISQDC